LLRLRPACGPQPQRPAGRTWPPFVRLDLPRIFLNYRTFARSERPGRVGKSPAGLMTGKQHPHWLELPCFKRFRRSPVPAWDFIFSRRTRFPFQFGGSASLCLCHPALAVFEPCRISIPHSGGVLQNFNPRLFLPAFARPTVMPEFETFVEGLALLGRQRGIESLRGGEDCFLPGNMFLGKGQHLFHALRRWQSFQRFQVLTLLFPALAIPPVSG